MALQKYAGISSYIDINDSKYTQRWILLAIACAFMVQDSEELVPAAWEEWKIAPFTLQVTNFNMIISLNTCMFYMCMQPGEDIVAYYDRLSAALIDKSFASRA